MAKKTRRRGRAKSQKKEFQKPKYRKTKKAVPAAEASSPQQASQMDARWRKVLVDALQREASAMGRNGETGLFERSIARPKPRDEKKIRGIFNHKRPLALVRFDTPSIQNYLFRVMRPVDVEGGSQLVEDFVAPLTETVSAERLTDLENLSIRRVLATKHGVPDDAFVYCGGGGGLLIVASSEVAAMIETIEGLLTELTDGELRTVAASVNLWPWEPAGARIDSRSSTVGAVMAKALAETLGPLRQASPYAEALAALEIRVQRRRSEIPLPSLGLRGVDVHQRCDACARRPGMQRSNERGESVKLCRGCAERRRRGRRAKVGHGQVPSYEGLVEGLKDPGLAVLYADGANMGGIFQHVQTPAQHRAMSEAVGEAMKKARQAAVDAAKEASAFSGGSWLEIPEEGGVRHRWQSPLMGGDDLILILPASLASSVMLPLIREFEAAFDHSELLETFGRDDELRIKLKRLGLGIGCVIVDWMFPIKFSLDYAKALLSNAKAKIRELGGGSAVDFMVLKNATPLSSDLKTLRQKIHGRTMKGGPYAEGSGERLWMTRRPYSTKGFEELLAKAEALKKVHSSQRHLVLQELDRGYSLSRSLWRYQHARAEGEESWGEFRDSLGASLSQVDTLLWQPIGEEPGDSKGFTTDYLDAMDWVHLLESRDAIQERLNRSSRPERGVA